MEKVSTLKDLKSLVSNMPSPRFALAGIEFRVRFADHLFAEYGPEMKVIEVPKSTKKKEFPPAFSNLFEICGLPARCMNSLGNSLVVVDETPGQCRVFELAERATC